MMERKRILLESYLEITQQMYDVVNNVDYEEKLPKLLAKREHIISQLNELDKSVDSSIVDLLKEIKVLDEKFIQRLHELKNEAAQQLYLIKQAKEVKSRYYGETEIIDSIFYDKRK